RLEIVYPASQRRQAHQNGFGAASRFQPEYGAAVIKQIEFHIPAAAVQLKLTLFVRERFVAAPEQNWQVSGKERVAQFRNECEILIALAFEVVEEQAPNTPGFIAMFQKEIFVAPLFKSRIVLRIVPVANVLEGPMEVNGILLMRIIRSQVRAAAEPRGVALFKISE